MGWTNPRWGSLTGPDAETLRNIFQSLADWSNNPTFGYATTPTISGSGVQVPPSSLIVRAEWIQSANFAAGSAGWQIKATGDAEFNSVTIRGQIHLVNDGFNVIFIRHSLADQNGSIQSATIHDGAAMRPGITITTPVHSSQPVGPYMTFQGKSATGGDRKWSVSLADYYMIGGRLEVDEVNGNVEVFGAFIAGSATLGSTITSGLTVSNASMQTTGGGHIHSSGRVMVQAPFAATSWAGEGVITTGSSAGIRIGQRSRGSNDGAHSWAIYGNNDHMYWYHSNLGDIFDFAQSGGFIDWKVYALPALAATDNLSYTLSRQVGFQASSSKYKHNIRPLESPNPLWKLRPVRFNWRDVADAEEVNSRLPDGTAGLIAEEVAEVAPDAVTVDEDGAVRGINQPVLQGYLIHAAQELNRRVVALEEFTKIIKKV